MKAPAKKIKLNQPATNSKVSCGINKSIVQQCSKHIFWCPRLVVKHTSKWIPCSFGPRRDVVFKTKNKSFVTCACGELDQILE